MVVSLSEMGSSEFGVQVQFGHDKLEMLSSPHWQVEMGRGSGCGYKCGIQFIVRTQGLRD